VQPLPEQPVQLAPSQAAQVESLVAVDETLAAGGTQQQKDVVAMAAAAQGRADGPLLHAADAVLDVQTASHHQRLPHP